MSNVVSLDAYRARTRQNVARCLEPGCVRQAVWFTAAGLPVTCDDHNPPIPAPAPAATLATAR